MIGICVLCVKAEGFRANVFHCIFDTLAVYFYTHDNKPKPELNMTNLSVVSSSIVVHYWTTNPYVSGG